MSASSKAASKLPCSVDKTAGHDNQGLKVYPKNLTDGGSNCVGNMEVIENILDADEHSAGSILYYLNFDENFHALSTTHWMIF